MNWTEVKIFTTTEGLDLLCGALLEIGIKGFVIEDPQDFQEFLADPNPTYYIDEELMARKNSEANLKLYVADNPQGMEQLASAREIVARLKARDKKQELGRLECELCSLNEEDWSNAWKQYYHPVRIGKNLVVCPAWETYTTQPEDILLLLEPGMAFGTGTHASTRLCMMLLEEHLTQGGRMLDLGCGSGILAITAALLGAEEVIGCDIDETAVQVAEENAKRNRTEEKISFYQGDLTAHAEGKFQVICANIVADVILRLCENVGEYLAEEGVFIASGIIDEREEEVLRTMEEKGLTVIGREFADGWVALAAKATAKKAGGNV